MAKTGRRSVWDGKKTKRVQALITPEGMRRLDQQRRSLAAAIGWAIKDISDAAVVEWLARDKELPA